MSHERNFINSKAFSYYCGVKVFYFFSKSLLKLNKKKKLLFIFYEAEYIAMGDIGLSSSLIMHSGEFKLIFY